MGGQLLVQITRHHELGVRPFSNNFPVIQDDDAVCCGYRGQSVSDDQRGPPGRGWGDGVLYDGFAPAVQTRRRLVQQENRSAACDRPRNRKTLALTTAHTLSVLSKDFVQIRDRIRIIRVDKPYGNQRSHALRVVQIGSAEHHVVPDRPRQHSRVLIDVGQTRTQPVARQPLNISALDVDLTQSRLIEAFQ